MVLDFVEMSRPDEIESLRIPLFMLLEGSVDSSLRIAIGLIYRTVLLFVSPPERLLPATRTGAVMFCIPHGTPSNISNILPIVEDASSRGGLGGILMGGFGSRHEVAFGTCTPTSLDRLVAGVPAGKRVRCFWRAIRTLCRVRKLSRRQFPQIARSLNGKFSFLLNQISLSLLVREVIGDLLELWRPSAVITSSDFWPFEYEVVSAAKKNAILTLVVQHGIVDPFWWPFCADRLLLWGRPFEEQMVALGAPRDRLSLVGMPATDQIFRSRGADEDGWEEETVDSCLIISQTNAAGVYPDAFKKYYAFLKETIGHLSNVEWRIKLHPVEDGKFYLNLQREVGAELKILPKGTKLDAAVRDSRISLTVFSTAGLEVMIMQRPLIVLNVSPHLAEFAWWPSQGGGVYASSPSQLRTTIRQLLSDRKAAGRHVGRQNEFIASCFENPGYAAKAVMDHVVSLTPSANWNQNTSPCQ